MTRGRRALCLVPLYLAHCKVFWTTLWGQPLSHLFPGPQLQYSLAQAVSCMGL